MDQNKILDLKLISLFVVSIVVLVLGASTLYLANDFGNKFFSLQSRLRLDSAIGNCAQVSVRSYEDKVAKTTEVDKTFYTKCLKDKGVQWNP